MFCRSLILFFLSVAVFRICPAYSHDEVTFLTWNLWGIPWVTPATSARIATGVEVIRQRSPDVICLQEIWGRSDVDSVRKQLGAAGYAEVHHFPSWPYGSGLIIATRHPVLDSGFAPYTLRGKFYKPWHGDWYGGKGVAWVDIEVNGARLRILNTHLHSSEGNPTGEYLPTKLAQMGELIAVLKRHQKTGAAVVLCGDLNARLQELPMLYLLDHSAMQVKTAGRKGERSLDWILLQNGEHTRLGFLSYQRIPAPAFSKETRVSDHPLVVATVRVSDTVSHDLTANKTPADEETQQQVLHTLQEAHLDSAKKMRCLLILDGILLFALLPGVLPGRRVRQLRWALMIALAIGAAWTIHFYDDQKGLNAAIIRHESL